MLFKYVLAAALILYVSAVPVPDPPPAPEPPKMPETAKAPEGQAPAAAATVKPMDIAPPPVDKKHSELAGAIVRIAMSNKVGGVPLNCVPHKVHDVLVCNFPSMLKEGDINSGIKELKEGGMKDFENIEYKPKTKSGHRVIKWGACPTQDSKVAAFWSPYIGLTRIFGGRSCVVVHLTDAPMDVQIKVKATQMAVQSMVKKAMGEPGVEAKAEAAVKKDVAAAPAAAADPQAAK